MCARLIGVPAGKPFRSKRKSTVPDWIAPAASRVRLNVITAVPRPLASAFDAGGTSLVDNRVELNVLVFGAVVGAVGLSSPPHPPASKHVSNSSPHSLIAFASGSNQNLRAMLNPR